MKKRRSDIPSRTGRVENRRFRTYCSIIIGLNPESESRSRNREILNLLQDMVWDDKNRMNPLLSC
jgi:hypothetical protein